MTLLLQYLRSVRIESGDFDLIPEPDCDVARPLSGGNAGPQTHRVCRQGADVPALVVAPWRDATLREIGTGASDSRRMLIGCEFLTGTM
jgi:hypothetical protein